MKHFICALPFILLLAFVSCDKDDNTLNTGENPDSSSLIAFDMRIGEAIISSGSKLKMSTGTDFKSVWETGDEVGLFIVKGNASLQASGNWADNVKMTFDGSKWDYSLPSGKEYYPNDGEKLSFYAYYPYNASMDPLNYPSAVPTNQHYWPSPYDFLWAKKEDISKSSTPVQLQFSHALAMVQVKAGIFDTWDVNLNMFEAIIDYTVNLASQSITPGSTKNNIRMWIKANTPSNGEFVTTNWVLLPPQTMDIRVGWMYKNTPYTATPATNATFTGGKVHKYDTWYDNPNRTYAVGDVYPHPAMAIGVVYEITNGGKNGKIVSLDEGTSLQWGNEGDFKAQDTANGLVNMKTLFTIGSTFSGFPSFAWVHAKNNAGETYGNPTAKRVWYLPSVNELKTLYNVRNTVNSGLTGIGGTNLSEVEYWSSTANGPQHANLFNFKGNFHQGAHRGTMCFVRAIMAF